MHQKEKPSNRGEPRLQAAGAEEAAEAGGPLPIGADKLALLLRSRKFWAAVVAITLVILGARAGIDQAELTAAVVTIVGYILGTALEDGLSA
jgi:hypothetical protein